AWLLLSSWFRPSSRACPLPFCDFPPPQAAGPGLSCLQSLRSVADSSRAVYGKGDGRFGCRCIIIRTAPRRFQVAYAHESSQILTHFVLQIPAFCKSRAGAAIPRQSTDSFADKSGRIHRKSADFL